MRFETFNEDGDRDLLFVMGWGNQWTHEPVRWLIDELVDADANWRVHAAQIPTNVTDYRAQWVEPVADYARDLDDFALLGHSAGGLVATAVDGADTRVYLSPWWGYPADLPGTLLDILSQLPVSIPLVPGSVTDTSLLGRHATDRQITAVPSRVSPAFIRETRRAQETLLPVGATPDETAGPERRAVDHEAVVFCSLTDEIVSTRAIGQRVPASHVVLYDGGHELFSSRSRGRHLPTVLAALEEGVDALA